MRRLGAWAGGEGTDFVARMPPLSCQAEYAHIIAGRTPAVKDQDLRQLVAWLSNRLHLAGMIAGLLSPARHRRPVVVVVARGAS